MGQKVNPHGLRVGIIKDWDSKWYANKRILGEYLVEDTKVREHIKKSLHSAGILQNQNRTHCQQTYNQHRCCKTWYCYRQRRATKDELKAQIEKMTNRNVHQCFEVKSPDLMHSWLLKTLQASSREEFLEEQ